MVDVTDTAHLGAPVASTPTVYVFGAFGRAGHYIRSAGGDVDWHAAPREVQCAMDNPPRSAAEIEGEIANVVRVAGWSGVTWWDRQGDRRSGSHTGLLAFGDFTPAELIALGRRQAPWAFRVDVRVGGAP